MVDNERVRFLHYIRQHELEASLEAADLEPGARVLDFGAGDGFGANLLSNKGYNVSAVDLAPRSPQHFPVIITDTPGLPFADQTFDLIFSSNVIEHVENLPETLDEFRRILKPGSYCVFTMPTPVWRFFSLAELPIAMLVNARRPRLFDIQDQTSSTSNPPPKKKKKGNIIKRGIRYISNPHGAFPSSFHELITFSEGSWRRAFEKNKYEVLSVKAMPLFYTGGMLLPGKFIPLRRAIPTRYTASCLAYCVRPK